MPKRVSRGIIRLNLLSQFLSLFPVLGARTAGMWSGKGRRRGGGGGREERAEKEEVEEAKEEDGKKEPGLAFRGGYEIARRRCVNDVFVVFPPRDTHTVTDTARRARL